MTFNELNLIEPINMALTKAGYVNPTPIQAEAIPILIEGNDLLGCAQTGTGKTAAFSIPIIQHIYQQKSNNKSYGGIKALVLTPTRELAIQIDESFATYGEFTKLRHTVIFGGVGQKSQVDALRAGVDLLVATPGRLLDLIAQGYIKLNNLEFFVLDEADHMLDMGFIHDIKRILPLLPKRRQSLFFSATMPREIEYLANTILTKPKKVEVAPASSTVDTVAQYLYYEEDKNRLLVELLEDNDFESVLVFTRTKYGADKVARMLSKAKITAEAIHGNKSQNARQKSLKSFKEHKTRVLIATDIASRGIDIDYLSCVVNYELPNVPETYVHRIGRTGRAGREGVAYSFCRADEMSSLRDIEKLIGRRLEVVGGEPFSVSATKAAVDKKRANREGEIERRRAAKSKKTDLSLSPRKNSTRESSNGEKRGAKSANYAGDSRYSKRRTASRNSKSRR